jgi:hypothetical protein
LRIASCAFICVVAGLAAGLWAAYCWWKASKVEIDPGGVEQTCDPELIQMSWTTGIMKAVGESARLNKIAALWTAVAVLLNAVSSVLGYLGK